MANLYEHKMIAMAYYELLVLSTATGLTLIVPINPTGTIHSALAEISPPKTDSTISAGPGY